MYNKERSLKLLEDANLSLAHIAHVILGRPETPVQATAQDFLRIAHNTLKAAAQF